MHSAGTRTTLRKCHLAGTVWQLAYHGDIYCDYDIASSMTLYSLFWQFARMLLCELGARSCCRTASSTFHGVARPSLAYYCNHIPSRWYYRLALFLLLSLLKLVTIVIVSDNNRPTEEPECMVGSFDSAHSGFFYDC